MSSTKFVFFGLIRKKNKMVAAAFDWQRYFWLLLWNGWTEFNETWQEPRSQCPLQSLCLSGRSQKQDGHPDLWLAEIFSVTVERNSMKLDRKEDTKFMFFWLIGKNKMTAVAHDWLRHFQPLNRIQRNLTESKISTSSTKIVFFRLISKT